MIKHERLEKHVAAFLQVMRSTGTYRSVHEVMKEARVPEDEAAEVASHLERKKLIARPIPRLVTLTHWGRTWDPREQYQYTHRTYRFGASACVLAILLQI